MSGLRVVVLGYVVGFPLGGMTWHSLQYPLGLQRMGQDVWVIEDSGDYASCYDPVCGDLTEKPRYGLRYAADVYDRVGLGDRWAFRDGLAGTWHGPAGQAAEQLCATADVVVNLAGIHPLREWLRSVPVRVFVDCDPAFTQIRHLHDPTARAHAEAHTHFLSFGESVGTPSCAIPDDGLPWQPTRQPVVLDAWPVTAGPRGGPVTTVMQWDSYASQEHDGVRYGMKSASFAPYAGLPSATAETLQLALGKRSAEANRLGDDGWVLSDPQEATWDPWVYQRFIAASKAEFSVAKDGYVRSRSGWFSERSANYLASGRPVVLQDTGFSAWLPTGEGVLAFSSPEQARDALADLDARYPVHQRAAREVAASHFAAEHVLEDLLRRTVDAP